MPRGRKKDRDGEPPPPPKSRKKRGAAASAGSVASANAANVQQFNNSGDMLPPYHNPQDNMYQNYQYNDYPPHPSMMNRPMPGSSMMNQGAMPPMNNRYGPPANKSNEKIFPMNSPRVFNPANPNAPPVYVCGICQKEVHDNDQAIMCESGCSFWYHRACTGMTENAFALLTNEVYAEWACEGCFDKGVAFIKCKP